MRRVHGVRFGVMAATLAFAGVTGQTPAAARIRQTITITAPPGYGEKTYSGLPGANPNPLAPPTYDECEQPNVAYCDRFVVRIDQGRPNGHTTKLTLTWKPSPGEADAADLNMILWNPEARAQCPTGAPRFCGSEGSAIGGTYPEKLTLFDLPPGDYLMHVWRNTGTNDSYTLRGDIEFIQIAPRPRAPTPPAAATPTAPASKSAVATLSPVPASPGATSPPPTPAPPERGAGDISALPGAARPASSRLPWAGQLAIVLAAALAAAMVGALIFVRVLRTRADGDH